MPVFVPIVAAGAALAVLARSGNAQASEPVHHEGPEDEANGADWMPGQKEQAVPDQLTTNFKLSEFRCHDGTDVPDELRDNVQELAENLQVLRDHVGVSVSIVSGYRTPAYNAKVEGATGSQHMKARAADITIAGMEPPQVCKLVKQLIDEGQMKQGGVGLYKGWVHYDTRGTAARWGGA
jgi:uncharacterized protein YcbK (DUF882 family)